MASGSEAGGVISPVLDTRFQNRSEPVPNCSGSAVPTYKVEPQPEPLPEPPNARRLPYGMTYQQWQAAITAGCSAWTLRRSHDSASRRCGR